jgi:hypothetical protein
MRRYDKIEGVWGDWTDVDSARDLSVGQRVRYRCDSFNCGYEDNIFVDEIHESDCTTWDGKDHSNGTGSLFGGTWEDIQVFVPEQTSKTDFRTGFPYYGLHRMQHDGC